MNLFRFSRENEDVFDKPHVSLKIGLGCPAGCDCEFSYKKLKKNTLYSKSVILRNLKYVYKNFSDDFEIFLVGLNLLKYNYLFEILDNIILNGRIFKLQIPHNLDSSDIKILSELISEYGKFNCSIPKTIDSKNDLLNLIKEIQILSKIKGLGKVYFDIFLDLKSYDKIIKIIINKFSTNKSNNEYNCIIGNKFDLKFHDLSWSIDNENKIIKNLKRKECLMKNYFQVKDNFIYLEDHIEIGANGDFTFHDNLCYLGNFSISNISFDKNKIIKDFNNYYKYILKISDGDLKINCYKCIKNGYKYKK